MATCLRTESVYELRPPSGIAWDAWTSSQEALVGNGSLQFSVPSGTLATLIGVDWRELGEERQALSYGLYFRLGQYWIREFGSDVAGPFSFSSSDVFHIERANGQVRYSRNGAEVRVSSVSETRDLWANLWIGAGESGPSAAQWTQGGGAYLTVPLHLVALGSELCEGGGGGDPHWDDVSLLVPLETDTSDESSFNLAGTVVGTPSYVTDNQPGWASGSTQFAAGQHITYPIPAISAASDFTYEYHFSINSWGNNFLFSVGSGVDDITTAEGFAFYYNSTNQRLYHYRSGDVQFWPYNLTLDTWHHLALVRANGSLTLFLDGVSLGTISGSGYTITEGFRIGDSSRNGIAGFNGNACHFRVTVGVARYTNNFTPPTGAFPASGESGGDCPGIGGWADLPVPLALDTVGGGQAHLDVPVALEAVGRYSGVAIPVPIKLEAQGSIPAGAEVDLLVPIGLEAFARRVEQTNIPVPIRLEAYSGTGGFADLPVPTALEARQGVNQAAFNVVIPLVMGELGPFAIPLEAATAVAVAQEISVSAGAPPGGISIPLEAAVAEVEAQTMAVGVGLELDAATMEVDAGAFGMQTGVPVEAITIDAEAQAATAGTALPVAQAAGRLRVGRARMALALPITVTETEAQAQHATMRTALRAQPVTAVLHSQRAAAGVGLQVDAATVEAQTEAVVLLAGLGLAVASLTARADIGLNVALPASAAAVTAAAAEVGVGLLLPLEPRTAAARARGVAIATGLSTGQAAAMAGAEEAGLAPGLPLRQVRVQVVPGAVGWGLGIGLSPAIAEVGAGALALALALPLRVVRARAGVAWVVVDAGGQVLLVNLDTLATTTLGDVVRQVLVHQDELYAVTASGLMRLDGDPQGMTLVSGELKLAGGRLARVPYATVSAQAGGPITLTLAQNLKGRIKTLGPYSVARVAGSEEREYRARLGGGHQGNAYAVTVNASGGCKLSGIDFDVRATRGDN